MPLLSTLLQATHFTSPFLRTLIPSIGLAYAIQGAVAIPSILAQSEKFYDLSGSLTYLSCAALSLYLPTIRARYVAQLAGKALPEWPSLLGALMGRGGVADWRRVVLSAGVGIWATRCGCFCFFFLRCLGGRMERRGSLFFRGSRDESLGHLLTGVGLQWGPTSSRGSPPTATIPASTTSGPRRRNSSVLSSPRRLG